MDVDGLAANDEAFQRMHLLPGLGAVDNLAQDGPSMGEQRGIGGWRGRRGGRKDVRGSKQNKSEQQLAGASFHVCGLNPSTERGQTHC